MTTHEEILITRQKLKDEEHEILNVKNVALRYSLSDIKNISDYPQHGW